MAKWPTVLLATLFILGLTPPVQSQDGSSTITLNAQQVGTSLFTASSIPAQTGLHDRSPLELGVKFTSSVAGQITALKFYRSPRDTGPNLLHLWTSTGTKLASASFTDTKATGWQTVNLPIPVTISADKTYIASYHTTGIYAATSDFFTEAVSSGALTAPSSDAGGNGVYSYGGTSTGGIFPTRTFKASNYFADVAFSSSETPTYSVGVSAAPSQGGSVSGGGSFVSGSSATLVANPATGYSFVNWTENGTALSSSASYSFIVAASRNLVANFVTSQPPFGGILPADRTYAWNPGLMSKGGIPDRKTICAKLSPDGNIQAALDSCPNGQVVQLTAGTFTVNNYLLVHRGITLRGAGAGQTILVKTNGAKPRTSTIVAGTKGIFAPVDGGYIVDDAQAIIIVGPSRWPGPANSTSKNLVGDSVAGSNSVTIASAGGFAPGQFVLLDELSGATHQPVVTGFGCSGCTVLQSDRVAWNIHDPYQTGDDPSEAKSWFMRTDRPTNEIKEIASVSGRTISFTSPLSIGYRVSHSAQLTRYTMTGSQSTANSIHVVNAGVENLSLKGGSDGALRFQNAAFSWAKNVEITQWLGSGVDISGSFRVEVRDSYIHQTSWPEPGGGGYALSFANGSSEALIENNIMTDVNKVMVFRASGAGSVVGYNYIDDGWIYATKEWVEVGLNASHMTGPHHVLFEGNYSFNADSDYTHGNAIYLTFFRNWLSGQRRSLKDTGNVRAVGLAYGAWWDSFVGNVLGRPGLMRGWHYTDPAMGCDASGNNCSGNASWSDKDIWKLGYDPVRWGMYADPKTLSTVIRDGNYDFLSNSQKWHNTPSGFAMPESLYLKAKPAYFGSNAWPWVNPSNGSLGTLPAKARFDNGTYFCNSGC